MGSWPMQRFQEQSGKRRPPNFHAFVFRLGWEAGVVHAATFVRRHVWNQTLAAGRLASGEGPARALHGSPARLDFASQRQSSWVLSCDTVSTSKRQVNAFIGSPCFSAKGPACPGFALADFASTKRCRRAKTKLVMARKRGIGNTLGESSCRQQPVHQRLACGCADSRMWKRAY